MHGESFRLETKVLPEKATQAVGMIKTNPDGGYGGVLSDGVFYAAEVGTYSVMAYIVTSELGGLDGIDQRLELLCDIAVDAALIAGNARLSRHFANESFKIQSSHFLF